MSLDNEPWSNGSSPLQQPPPPPSSCRSPCAHPPPNDTSRPRHTHPPAVAVANGSVLLHADARDHHQVQCCSSPPAAVQQVRDPAPRTSGP